jgi:hypothetical protein
MDNEKLLILLLFGEGRHLYFNFKELQKLRIISKEFKKYIDNLNLIYTFNGKCNLLWQNKHYFFIEDAIRVKHGEEICFSNSGYVFKINWVNSKINGEYLVIKNNKYIRKLNYTMGLLNGMQEYYYANNYLKIMYKNDNFINDICNKINNNYFKFCDKKIYVFLNIGLKNNKYYYVVKIYNYTIDKLPINFFTQKNQPYKKFISNTNVPCVDINMPWDVIIYESNFPVHNWKGELYPHFKRVIRNYIV